MKNAKNRQRIRPPSPTRPKRGHAGKGLRFSRFSRFSRSLRVFFAFFFAHGLFYWIFHSSIRRVAETKLTPILKSLREAAAKGLASPFSSICCKASSALVSPRPENGEDGIIFPLVKKPDNVAKYVRRIKAKAGQHRVHAGLRKGEHGEESGGNEPDGRDVLMKNGKSEQRKRGPYLIIPLCSFCGTDACLRWMKNVRD